MSRPRFKSYNPGQTSLFPSSLDEKIPLDSPARLIDQIIESLDISSIIDTYGVDGCSSYHPRMMLKVVVYAYLNNIYSCRKIESALQDRVTFMWLSGNQLPDHNTINRFRSLHLKDSIHELFTQVVILLVQMGYLSLHVAYFDGTKIESRANKYTFVWRKSVEKNKAKLEEKIRKVLEQVEEGIAQDNDPDDDDPTPINSQELKKRIEALNRQNRSKEDKKAIKSLEEKHLPKLQEYENHLQLLGNRNSYSKTDPDATFMRMKDDHMMNGQLKPAYNVQIATVNQFITHYDFFSNPTDTLTFIPFMEGYKTRYGKMPDQAVGDSGYGSEENYEFMQEHLITPFVKFNYFHKEQKRSFNQNAFDSQNLFYNAKDDYFVCPMGQHMQKMGTSVRKTQSGYISQLSIYQSQNCIACPLKSLCHQAVGNRQLEVNHNLNSHKQKVRELLTSQEGLKHRSRRPIEPEAVFGQMKYNKQYNRLRHFSKEKAMMDFAIFALAFNILKCWRRKLKILFFTSKTKNRQAKAKIKQIDFKYICMTNKNYTNAA